MYSRQDAQSMHWEMNTHTEIWCYKMIQLYWRNSSENKVMLCTVVCSISVNIVASSCSIESQGDCKVTQQLTVQTIYWVTMYFRNYVNNIDCWKYALENWTSHTSSINEKWHDLSISMLVIMFTDQVCFEICWTS